MPGRPCSESGYELGEAPVQSLKTGDRKRDKDLNKSMESSKYPNLRFDLNRITAKKAAGDSIPVTLHGTLNIHGVTRRLELPGTIEFKGANARVRSDFPLNLKEYGIGGLSKMLGILKMHDNIEVHVDLFFRPAQGAESWCVLRNGPDPCRRPGRAVRSKGPSPSARPTISEQSEPFQDER